MQRKAIQNSTRQYINSVNIAKGYDQHFADEQLFQYDSTLLHEWFGRPRKIIDLGCGTGRHLLQFARKGCEVVGVDLSAEMLAQTRAKLQAEGLHATLLLADLTQLDQKVQEGALLKESCDVAICMFSTLGLIHGHENRGRFLQQIRTLLSPEGELAIHVHNYGYNFWRHEGRIFLLTNLARKIMGKDQLGDKYLSYYRGISQMYIHVFRIGEIKQLLTQSGFKVVEFVPLNSRRTRPLRFPKLAFLLANGFIIRAKKS